MKFEKYPQLQRLKLTKGVSWCWFRDTALQRPIIFVVGVDTFAKAREAWKAIVGDPACLDKEGAFAGLHVALMNGELLVGSVIFISIAEPDTVAHEVAHGVLRHMEYQSISDEETICTFVSGWVSIFGRIFKWATK